MGVEGNRTDAMCYTSSVIDMDADHRTLHGTATLIAVFNGIMVLSSTVTNVVLIVALRKQGKRVTPSKLLLTVIATVNLMVACVVQPFFIGSIFSQVNKTMKNCFVETAYSFTGYSTMTCLLIATALLAGTKAGAVYLKFRYNTIITKTKCVAVLMIFVGASTSLTAAYCAEVLSRKLFLLFMAMGLLLCLSAIIVFYFYLAKYLFQDSSRLRLRKQMPDLKSKPPNKAENTRRWRLITIGLLVTFSVICYFPQGLLLAIRSHLEKAHAIFVYDLIADSIAFCAGTINPLCFLLRYRRKKRSAENVTQGMENTACDSCYISTEKL